MDPTNLVVQNSYDGLVLVDGTGAITYVNPASERLWCPYKRPPGTRVANLVKDGLLESSASLSAMEARRPVTRLHRLPSGRAFFATAVPLVREDGVVAGVVVNERDVAALLDPVGMEAPSPGSAGLATRSAVMRCVMDAVRRVAPTNATVLVTGETGTGKTALCELIHGLSPRRSGPFSVINSAAIPATLIESQLFGYIEGSFTGAARGGRKGVLESARGGTVVLDEVAEMPVELQPKLLQLLDDQAVLPVGGERPIRFDVRFLATTNRDLGSALRSGLLRADLYYRLNVFSIRMPALRERVEDIPEISHQVIADITRKYGVFKVLSKSAMSRLVSYDWPGNVRELQTVLLRAAILSRGETIQGEDIDVHLSNAGHANLSEANLTNWRSGLQQAERQMLLAAAGRHGSLKELAESLGVSEPTLRRKARALFGSWRNLRDLARP